MSAHHPEPVTPPHPAGCGLVPSRTPPRHIHRPPGVLPLPAGCSRSPARGGLILLSAATLLLAGLPAPATAQVVPRAEALDEIRSLQVEVSVTGAAGAPAGLARSLERVVLEEMERARIPEELAPPRPRDCCLLRLDLRIASSRAGNVYGTGYTMRLDLGYPERVGGVEAWLLLWHGRTVDGVLDPADLPVVLGDRARELAVEFVDRYRERVPLRE